MASFFRLYYCISLFFLCQSFVLSYEGLSPWIDPLLEPSTTMHGRYLSRTFEHEKKKLFEISFSGKIAVPSSFQSEIDFHLGSDKNRLYPKCRIQLQKQITNDICPIRPRYAAFSLCIDSGLSSKKREKEICFGEYARFYTGFGGKLGKHILILSPDRYLKLYVEAHCMVSSYKPTFIYKVSSQFSWNREFSLEASYLKGYGMEGIRRKLSQEKRSISSQFYELITQVFYSYRNGNIFSISLKHRKYRGVSLHISTIQLNCTVPISL